MYGTCPERLLKALLGQSGCNPEVVSIPSSVSPEATLQNLSSEQKSEILYLDDLRQGWSTLFLESYSPVGVHSNPNLAHLILIISWLIS